MTLSYNLEYALPPYRSEAFAAASIALAAPNLAATEDKSNAR